jgi:hypothetical protein
MDGIMKINALHVKHKRNASIMAKNGVDEGVVIRFALADGKKQDHCSTTYRLGVNFTWICLSDAGENGLLRLLLAREEIRRNK